MQDLARSVFQTDGARKRRRLGIRRIGNHRRRAVGNTPSSREGNREAHLAVVVAAIHDRGGTTPFRELHAIGDATELVGIELQWRTGVECTGGGNDLIYADGSDPILAMLGGIDLIDTGKGRDGDLEQMLSLAANFSYTTICPLAIADAWPIENFIGKFRGEFDAALARNPDHAEPRVTEAFRPGAFW